MGKAALGGPESTGVGSFSFGAFGAHASTPTAQHDSTINVTVLVDQEGALDIAACFSYAKHSTRSGFTLVRIAAAGNPRTTLDKKPCQLSSLAWGDGAEASGWSEGARSPGT